MRKILAATASAGALLLAAAAPAANAAPNERACQNDRLHGTAIAHATVPYKTWGNRNAHSKIPHYCEH